MDKSELWAHLSYLLHSFKKKETLFFWKELVDKLLAGHDAIFLLVSVRHLKNL